MKKTKVVSTVLLICLFSNFSTDSYAVGEKTNWTDLTIGAVLGAAGTLLLTKAILPSFSKKKTSVVTPAPEAISEPSFFPYVTTLHDEEEYRFVGQDNVVEQVVTFFDGVVHHNQYKRIGAKKPKALFLEGPSGCGKTLLAHHIGSQFDCYWMPVSGYFLADESYGSGEAKVRFLFDIARKMSQEKLTVLFIDDFDVFSQMSNYYQINISKRKAVHTLVEEIEGLCCDDDNVVVMAAAKSSMELDPMLFKPGCFDRIVNIPLPTREGRADILNHYLQKVTVAGWSEEFAREAVERTAGFNGALLEDVVSEAALLAAQKGHDGVRQRDVEDAIRTAREKKQSMAVQDKEESFYYTFSEKTQFSDIKGLDGVLVEVKEVVDFLRNPEQYLALGARGPHGVLLHGPSGCGKTLIARAIAGEAGCCFISISGSEFVKKYVGTGAMSVRFIFNFARKMAKEVPVIIFIDEMDGLGQRRSLDASGGQTEYNNTINEILKQMDGFSRDENVVVVGATNLIEEMDSALLRSGRFDRKILVPLPTKAAREAILNYYLGKVVIAEDNPADKIVEEYARRTTGFSGAELENFVNEAAIFAAREGDSGVRLAHFDDALDKIMLGLATDLEQTEEQLRRTAYHEAGHALIAALSGMTVEKVSILPRGKTLGVTWTGKKDGEAGGLSKSELRYELTCLQGGYAAEQMIFGEATVGVQNDLERAGKLAFDMVRRFGMGEGELEGIAGFSVASDAMHQKFDEASMSLLGKTFVRAKLLLEEYRGLLDQLASALLEHETIGADMVFEIIGDQVGAEAAA